MYRTSEVDRKVHKGGAQLMDAVVWHPVGDPVYPILAENKDWREKHGEEMRRHTIDLARDALTYQRLREEQDMEGLTNKFARISLDDNAMNLRRRVMGQ